MMKTWWAYGKVRVQRFLGMGNLKKPLKGGMWEIKGRLNSDPSDPLLISDKMEEPS